MRVDTELIPIDSLGPMKGLYTDLPSHRIDPAYSPHLANIVVRDGVVIRRPGYAQLGVQLAGRVLALIEPKLVDTDTGDFINPLVVITDQRQYRYDNTTDAFIDITPGQTPRTIDTVTAVGSTFEFEDGSGSDLAKLKADKKVPISSSDNNDGIYTVVSATKAGTTITVTVTETLTEGGDLGQVDLADDWFLTETDNTIDYVTATDLDGSLLIITNGVEPLRAWTGEDTFEEWKPTDYTDFSHCKSLAVHNDHLFLGGINFEPGLVAWSDVGNFEYFSEGTAGVQYLTDVVGEIKAMVPLGDRLIIYSEDSIITAFFAGLPAVFGFETVIPSGVRLSGPRGIVSLNVGHIFASEENLYLFDGSRSLRTFGDAIQSDYKKTKEHGEFNDICAINDFARKTVYLAVPDVNDGVTAYTLEYNIYDLRQMVWGKERYADEPLCWGFFSQRTALPTWEDEQWEYDLAEDLGLTYHTPPPDYALTWEKETGPWFAESEQVGFPVRLFGTAAGKVYLCSEGYDSDNGTSFVSTYDTIDFTVPQAFLSHIGRYQEIQFEAKGGSVEVYTSVNQGDSYYLQDTVTLDNEYTLYTVPVDLSARTLRVRFRITSETFQLRAIRLFVTQGSPR